MKLGNVPVRFHGSVAPLGMALVRGWQLSRCDNSPAFSGRTVKLGNVPVRFRGSVAPLGMALVRGWQLSRCDNSPAFSGRTVKLGNVPVRFHGSVAPLGATSSTNNSLLVAARRVPPTTRIEILVTFSIAPAPPPFEARFSRGTSTYRPRSNPS